MALPSSWSLAGSGSLGRGILRYDSVAMMAGAIRLGGRQPSGNCAFAATLTERDLAFAGAGHSKGDRRGARRLRTPPWIFAFTAQLGAGAPPYRSGLFRTLYETHDRGAPHARGTAVL